MEFYQAAKVPGELMWKEWGLKTMHKVILWTYALYTWVKWKWEILQQTWWKITKDSNIATLGHIWFKIRHAALLEGDEKMRHIQEFWEQNRTIYICCGWDTCVYFRLKRLQSRNMWTYAHERFRYAYVPPLDGTDTYIIRYMSPYISHIHLINCSFMIFVNIFPNMKD